MSDQPETSVQELHAPNSICFGCGPSNPEGLQIRSFRSNNGLTMKFNPSSEHQAFPGMINGGIIGTLMDCHGNWTAAIALMDQSGDSEPPCTVTANYSIKLRRPTPFGHEIQVTGEEFFFSNEQFNEIFNLAKRGIGEIIELQKKVLM